MFRDPVLYLDDIIEATDVIKDYSADMTFEAFAADRKTVDAVIRNLAIIGEAANKLSEEARSAMPAIEWRKIVALRNILVHEYFGVSKPIIWDIIKSQLPVLREACMRYRQELD